MFKAGFPSMFFQVFYISKEETRCPLVFEIIKTGKKLKEERILDEGCSAVISLGYGKRMLINGFVEDFSNIRREELLEVVDYDPIKRNLLVIGPCEPKPETSIHWMIHYARDEVNVVIQINDEGLIDELKNKIPTVEKDGVIGSIEQVKNVMKHLRDSRVVGVKNLGVLFVGSSVEEVENLVLETIKKDKN